MTSDHPNPPSPTRGGPNQPGMDAAAWDARYAQAKQWSGQPNASLAWVLGDAGGSGSALDLGCGEGADAIWLARHGWQVTGLDWSGTAIARAREHAEAMGVSVEFVAGDLTAPGLGLGRFDLVVAAFLHPHPDDRDAIYRRVARFVAPGGRLLVVAHSHAHAAAGHGGPDPARLLDPEELLAAAQLGAARGGPQWQVRRCEIRSRPDGVDSVVLAELALGAGGEQP